MAGFSAAVQANAPASRRLSRATTTMTQPFDWSGSCGTGTVNMTGSVTNTMTMPDENTPAPVDKTMYANFINMMMDMSMDGTITSATFSNNDAVNSHTYTVSGKLTALLDMDFSVDLYYDTSLPNYMTLDWDMGFKLKYGAALSVTREDGLGAKYIISYVGKIQRTDVSIDPSDPLAMQNSMGNIETELAAQKATLSVYNDANTLLYSSEINVSDLNSIMLP